MSVRVTSRVWDQSRQKHSALLALLALADAAQDDGVCWLSVTKLAHRARVETRQIKRILSALEAAGEIWTYRRGGGRDGEGTYQVNVYFVTCGLNMDSLINVLTAHPRIALQIEDAETTARHILSRRSSGGVSPATPLQDPKSVVEDTPEHESMGVTRDIHSDFKGVTGDQLGVSSGAFKGVTGDQLGVSSVTPPLKDEPLSDPSNEPSVEPYPSARQPATKLRKPARADFPPDAMPVLRAFLQVHGKVEHWQMDALPRKSADEITKLSHSWFLDGRAPEDVTAFLEAWPEYMRRRGATGDISAPTAAQWIRDADAVLRFAKCKPADKPAGRTLSAEERFRAAQQRSRVQFSPRKAEES